MLLTGYALLILLMWLIGSSLLPVLIGQVRQIVNRVMGLGDSFFPGACTDRYLPLLIQDDSDMISKIAKNTRIARVDQFMSCAILPPPEQASYILRRFTAR